jgi:hypothetical protein
MLVSMPRTQHEVSAGRASRQQPGRQLILDTAGGCWNPACAFCGGGGGGWRLSRARPLRLPLAAPPLSRLPVVTARVLCAKTSCFLAPCTKLISG